MGNFMIKSLKYISERYQPHKIFRWLGLLFSASMLVSLVAMSVFSWSGYDSYPPMNQWHIGLIFLYLIFSIFIVYFSILGGIIIYFIDVLPLCILYWASNGDTETIKLINKSVDSLAKTWRGSINV